MSRGEASLSTSWSPKSPKSRSLASPPKRANGVVAKAGFRKGDILVGLHRYETLSLDNVIFVLRKLEAPAKGSTAHSLRAHIVRDGKTVYGDLVLPVP